VQTTAVAREHSVLATRLNTRPTYFKVESKLHVTSRLNTRCLPIHATKTVDQIWSHDNGRSVNRVLSNNSKDKANVHILKKNQ